MLKSDRQFSTSTTTVSMLTKAALKRVVKNKMLKQQGRTERENLILLEEV